MEQADLGPSGLVVSRVGLGTACFSGYDYGRIDERGATAAVRRALELGVTLFDTADVYGFGRAEELLGNALGPAREEVVIATKVGVAWNGSGNTYRDLSPTRVVTALDASLRRLRVDSIPLYQVHWLDPNTPIDDLMDVLIDCQRAGKVRHFGFCNVGTSVLEEAARRCRVDALQLPFSLLERQHNADLVLARNQLQMTTLVYNVLAQGLLSGALTRASTFESSDLRRRSPIFSGAIYEHGLQLVRELWSIAAEYGRTPAQVAIRWVLDQNGVTSAIVGARSARQVEENAFIAWDLGGSHRERLDDLAVPSALASTRTPQ